MWHAVGAETVRMSPARHDRIIARVSHLPHVLAAALVRSALADPAARKVAAGSFLDMTRVAGSPPVLWKGIFLANRREVLAALAIFRRHLGEFDRCLRRGDGAGLAHILARAGALRGTVRFNGRPWPASSAKLTPLTPLAKRRLRRRRGPRLS
jgi:prephenate dehydrogenase